MNLHIRCSSIVIAAAIFAQPVSAQEIPSTEDLQDYLLIPSFWEIQDFRVVARQSTGTPISPLAQIRFEADVSPNADLFVETGAADLGPFKTIIASSADEDIRTLYGTMELRYAGGAWDGAVNIENPLTQMGAPIDAFSKPTVVLGTEEEDRIADLLANNMAAQVAADLAIKHQDLETEGQAEREALMRDHQDALTAIRVSFEKSKSDLEVRRSKIDAEHQEKIREAAAALDAEINALTITQEEQLRSLTESHEAEVAEHQVKIRDATAAMDSEIAALTQQQEERMRSLTESHEAEVAEHKANIRDATSAMDSEIASLSQQQDEELRELADAHRLEVAEMASAHATRLGEMIATQTQEIAEAETTYTVMLESLNDRIANSKEVISRQQALIEADSEIASNKLFISEIVKENAAENESAMASLLGTWRGNALCYSSSGEYVPWEVEFKPAEIVGRTVAGTFTNLQYATEEYVGRAVLSVQSDQLIPPLPMHLALSKNAIVAMSLDLTLTEDGFVSGNSTENRNASDEKICKEVTLVKVED